MLDRVVLPRKGKLSAETAAIEKAPEFVALRRKHSAVESSINALYLKIPHPMPSMRSLSNN
jgi:hypothetical protein